MLLAKDGEHQCQERGVTGQANQRRADIRPVCQTVNAMIEPVLGDVAVDEAVASDMRIAENKEQPQGESCERAQQEKQLVVADELDEAFHQLSFNVSGLPGPAGGSFFYRRLRSNQENARIHPQSVIRQQSLSCRVLRAIRRCRLGKYWPSVGNSRNLLLLRVW